MIKYTASASSPFVRKVILAIGIKGLEDKVAGITPDADPELNKAIRSKNPLHKLPTMMLEDGRIIHDSHVICDYLDLLGPPPRLFPTDIDARADTMTLGSLGDGIIEAALSVVLEKRFRPEDKWVQSWIDRQQAKVEAGLDWLETHLPAFEGSPDYGHLTVACALGYLDFRQEGAWRAGHPKLVAWLESFSASVPAYKATMPPKQ